MKIRFIMTALPVLLFFSCTPYITPYLGLYTEDVYTGSDIVIHYTYACEEQEQRCVCNLYSYSNPSVSLYSRDEVMPFSGFLDFTDLNLGEGNYRLEFAVYSERDGQYSLLKFLEQNKDFSIDFP